MSSQDGFYLFKMFSPIFLLPLYHHYFDIVNRDKMLYLFSFLAKPITNSMTDETMSKEEIYQKMFEKLGYAIFALFLFVEYLTKFYPNWNRKNGRSSMICRNTDKSTRTSRSDGKVLLSTERNFAVWQKKGIYFVPRQLDTIIPSFREISNF